MTLERTGLALAVRIAVLTAAACLTSESSTTASKPRPALSSARPTRR